MTNAVAGPAALKNLTEGEEFGAFRAKALYIGAGGAPIGARFEHASGMPVDVLFFASVPQLSVYAKTVCVSEKGEPHTGEHLLIGKGRIGKYLNGLLQMRLGEHTAGTYTDLTDYQFHTAAGIEGFTELTEKYLEALLRPEFTDEEIRREVCNLEVVKGEGGKLHLEEKGTVYNEMVSTCEKPGSVSWDQLGRMTYGAEHPLARNQGGEPAAIRALSVDEVRRFHAANYHLGPNMAMVVAIPVSWNVTEVLGRLERIFGRLASPRPPGAYARLPPPQPFTKPEIRIGAYPSDDVSSPQAVMFGFRPIDRLTTEESTRISLLLELSGGGETSYLHRDLVDRKTRVIDVDITGVGTYLGDPPMAAPVVSVDGLPVSAIDPKTLERVRDVVVKRLAWFDALKPGSPEAGEVARKARSLISSNRRSMLRFMDAPPHFGDRGTGIGWHRFLDHLCQEPGFRKELTLSDVYDRIDAALERGEVPWGAIARRAGLLDVPCTSAVKPDPALLARERADKAHRMQEAEAALVKRFGVKDGQAALARLAAEADAATAQLEARDRSIPLPPFVKDPPLTLDDVAYVSEPLPPGRGIIRTHFGSTPFTDIRLAFDLTRVPAGDLELLSVLDNALSDLGVEKDGQQLDYVAASERIREDIYALGCSFRGNAVTRRKELALSAHASSTAEIPRAVAWLEAYLFHRPTAAAKSARLVDVIRRSIKGPRNIFKQSEESWVQSASSAYVYQDQPAYMAVSSTFTVLRHLTRLRFRLEPDGPDKKAMEATLAEIDAAARAEGPHVATREGLAAKAAAASGEMAEFLAFELAHLPPATWRADLARLVSETRADLAAGPAPTLARIDALLARVLCQRGVRVQVSGNEANAARAAELARALVAKLPVGEDAPARLTGEPLVLANLKERLGLKDERPPVHVALVNDGTKTGVHVISAPGPGYRDASADAAVDELAAGLYAGSGPQAFFMKTWSAGLAYSNGMRSDPNSGRLLYYAERCPDLVQTMKFVAGLATSPVPEDASLVAYSLANAFGDYRGAEDFSSRGEALAANLVDGLTPEVVRAFKSRLVQVAGQDNVLAKVRARVPAIVGRVVMGVGPKVSATPGAVGFVIGPEELLAIHEKFLKDSGEAAALVRLYPRDFWPR